MEQKFKITVVIVNYNVKALLLTCLKTLYQYQPSSQSLEVIVVDNHSSDDSISAVRSAFPEVRIIENKHNAGFPAANNQAFQVAQGEYIFMLNPDTEFCDDSLSRMTTYLDIHSEIALIGPRLLNSDLSLQSSCWRYPTLSSIFWEMMYIKPLAGKKNYRDKDFNQSFEAESFSGAAILFRRDVFAKIGYLDEQLFWIEDIDFCYRAKKAGLKLLYYPGASIIHHIGQSAKKNYTISICNQVVNKIKFFRKYYPGLRTVLVVLLSFLHVCLKLILFLFLSPFKKVFRLKLSAYWYTLPRVFNPPLGMK
jgi:GT2 family glycosyltransferase